MKIGLHAPVSGATDTFKRAAANLQADIFLWVALVMKDGDTAPHRPADARAYPDATHILRLPNPARYEDPAAWMARVGPVLDEWVSAGIPPGALIVQHGNEPDQGGAVDLDAAWDLGVWSFKAHEYRDAIKARYPNLPLIAPPFTAANSRFLTPEYVAPYEGVAVHCYWAAGNPGWRWGRDGGAAWRCATPFGKPIYVTEVNSNPTDAGEIVAWAGEVDSPLVLGAALFIADSAASWPQYTVTPEQAGAVRAGLGSPTPQPAPVPPPPNPPTPPPAPPAPGIGLWGSIRAATSDPHVRGAMLMGAALETGTLVAPWPDQYGGGPGRGPFQIEAGPGGSHAGEISEEDARGAVTAVAFMLGEYERGVADILAADFDSDPVVAYAQAAYRAERPAQMYPDDRIRGAWALVQPLLGGAPGRAPYAIVTPVDCPVAQGSDGPFSHGGKVAGFYAIDYGCPEGTPVRAAADGTVGVTYWTDSNPISLRTGHSLWVAHDNGYATFSCHLSRFDVATGDRVAQGQIIGLTGTPGNGNGFGDGPHLHWEIWRGADPVHGARVRMETLEAAGVAGPWGGAPARREEDEVTKGDGFNADELRRLWYGTDKPTATMLKSYPYNPTFGIETAYGALANGTFRTPDQDLTGYSVVLGRCISKEEFDPGTPGRSVRYFERGKLTALRQADGSYLIRVN